MAEITLQGNPVHTLGTLPATGKQAPEIVDGPDYEAALDVLR